MSFVPPLPFGEGCLKCPVIDAESRLRSLAVCAYLDASFRESAMRGFAEWVLAHLNPAAPAADLIRAKAEDALRAGLPPEVQTIRQLADLLEPEPEEFRPTSTSPEGAP